MGLFGIALGITVAASAAAWLLNSATADEQRRHESLRRQIDELNKKLSQYGIEAESLRQDDLKRAVSQLLDKMAKQHKVLEEKIVPIDTELKRLPNNILDELKREDLSPYRRKALQQSFCKIEDAQSRLKAYQDYLGWYQQELDTYQAKLKEHFSADDAQLLIDALNPPSATLPDEWLYLGKVILVESNEIDRDITYNNRLHLTSNLGLQGWSNAQQKSMFYNYPDQRAIPLQIVYQKKGKDGVTNIFYGCVARGIAYVEGILTSTPLKFEIEKRLSLGYIAMTEDRAISAFLPRHLTPNPLIDLVQGQSISAWPELYNLTLDATPGNQRAKRNIQISMFSPATLGTEDTQNIYLYLKPEPIKERWVDALFANDPTPWRLLSWCNDSLTIARHTLQIECKFDINGGCLRANQLSEFQDLGEGHQLNFSIIPADVRLEAGELSNPDALGALLSFANQIAVNGNAVVVRQSQTRMLNQWRETIRYQQSKLEFHIEGGLSNYSESDHTITAVFDIEENQQDNVGVFLKEFKQVQRSKFTPQCRLAYWGSDGRDSYSWLEMVPVNRRRELNVIEDKGKLTVQFPCFQTRTFNTQDILQLCKESQQSMPFRLSLILFDDSLNRQESALESFKNDALVEPRIKDILLAPTLYQAEQNPFWRDHFANQVVWQNQELTPTQKQVIQTTLSEKYLSLIQGPPGTAKTTSIVEMLHQIYTYKPETRVLVVSQQHTAVDNALKRFVERHQPMIDDKQVRLLRIGPEEKVENCLKSYSIQQRQKELIEHSRTCAKSVSLSFQQPHAMIANRWLSEVLGEEVDATSTIDKELTWMLLHNNNLVGATCVGLASKKQSIDQLHFDVAIIDEAGRSTVPELMIPMLRAKKIILIGDHFQLPPSIASQLLTDEAVEELPFLKEHFLETSFFETLYEQLPDASKGFLSEQFRMPKAIGDLVATLFYSPNNERKLFNGREKSTEGFINPNPLTWVDIVGKEQQEGTSKFNEVEAEAIVTFISSLANRLKSGDKKSIAVITPYGAQKRLIRRKMALKCAEKNNGEYWVKGLKVLINTVDSFQGSEAEIVLYSVVRTQGNLRFILDWKRLNVACSRAEENLIFFGHLEFLRNKKMKNEERNLFAELIAQIPKEAILRIEHPKSNKGNQAKKSRRDIRNKHRQSRHHDLS
ncbi:AAA domain-containing protein [Vibrio nereis]|uniref:AAA domain-containing protein n=1 Tax=Vibrio nereis TaxID=693 RepID=UPI0024950AF8|nr:AAA domain-containing protein [Vibrio nereis]